jgi:aspartyl protease family protein
MIRPVGLLLFVTIAIGFAVPELQKLAATGPATPAPAAEAARPAGGGYRVELDADGRGHFQVEVSVDGRRLPMLVDTGATMVVLRRSDARTVGLNVLPGDFTATVSTANGKVSAARVRLNELTVRDITVRDIDALVLPDEVLETDLLGMNFFNRLGRFEIAGRKLIMEQ